MVSNFGGTSYYAHDDRDDDTRASILETLRTGLEEVWEVFANTAKAAMEKTVKAKKSQALEEAKTFEKKK